MHGPKALTDPRVWSIGLMREPCDYYLAAWSWGRLRRAGWLLKKMERSDPPAAAEFYGAGDADAARFGAWVRYVNDARAGGAAGAAPTCGLLSARLWAALLDPADCAWVIEQVEAHAAVHGWTKDRHVQARLAPFPPTRPCCHVTT